MGIAIIFIYALSVIILFSLLYTEKNELISYWICFLPFINTILLLSYVSYCIIKHIKQTVMNRKQEREWTIQERKMKAQGVYIVMIDEKKYTVSEKEFFN